MAALAGPSSAAALTTIGQLAPGNSPPTTCNALADIVQPTVQSGASYVVPAGGAKITSWSTNAAAGAGQSLEMKVFRQVSPLTYTVVAHDGPRSLAPSTLNMFVVNIPVQPGDLLGFNDAAASVSTPEACTFGVLGELYLAKPGDLQDGQTGGPFTQENDGRANISALVAIKPTDNSFTFGKAKDKKSKGTATLAVNVPGPGTLSLTGKGVKARRTGGAVASKTVNAAGTVKLSIKAKAKAKKKLNKTGKVKVKVSVTYTPTGDLPGIPKTETKRVKLIKKH
jgi:hypothetical protein